MDFSNIQLLSILLFYLSLPLATNATQVCAIIGSDGPVHCRSCPHVTCKIITTIPVGTKLNFTSYAVGDCAGDNCTWDFTPDDDCYVSGFYTSGNCNTSELPLSNTPSTTLPTTPSTTSQAKQSSSQSTSSEATATPSWAHVVTTTMSPTASPTSGSNSVSLGVPLVVGILTTGIASFLSWGV
ncbi:hypothetical protein BGW36DRAFT_380505 [Talaromyces proteolyticus]|uniref:Uncharacterized protein n=1 Tax=Talaromyces proteolyticus TaxID=1131652 RepID=A0AAD4KPM4_9EURO|nr:uncharacterized protein BGW36DRAFT_380505 [Talaromyces proteolyticus]KAH8696243.1 hypothetical protein BGW36DRAFT_380505 [Talaromyces proteolyticus]